MIRLHGIIPGLLAMTVFCASCASGRPTDEVAATGSWGADLAPFDAMIERGEHEQAFVLLGEYLSLDAVRNIPEDGAGYILSHTLDQVIFNHPELKVIEIMASDRVETFLKQELHSHLWEAFLKGL